MGNLAATYNALGRHEDALAMEESVLEFFRRVLPPRHPNIANTLYNISISYEQAGNMPRAVECAREALSIWQAALPPSHPHVTAAAENVRRLESRFGEFKGDDDADARWTAVGVTFPPAFCLRRGL